MSGEGRGVGGVVTMRFAVETWSPEYGSPTLLSTSGGDGPDGPDGSRAGTDVAVDVEVERPATAWAPIAPAATTLAGAASPSRQAPISFVDGVRRIEARVWVTGADGIPHPGICASFAAGVVRCGARAGIAAVRTGRGVFCRADGAADIVTRHGRFGLRVTAEDDTVALYTALHGAMTDLELAVGASVDEDDLLVVDGPLRGRRGRPGTVGFVKTHKVEYLPAPLPGVVSALRPGERTPLFCIGGSFPRHSWYLRLPGERSHPWAGVVRCEVASEADPASAAAAADTTSWRLVRYASTPHKDPRAPQNLFPIAGLERELRHRLGDPLVLQRALREAARSSASAPR